MHDFFIVPIFNLKKVNPELNIYPVFFGHKKGNFSIVRKLAYVIPIFELF